MVYYEKQVYLLQQISYDLPIISDPVLINGYPEDISVSDVVFDFLVVPNNSRLRESLPLI